MLAGGGGDDDLRDGDAISGSATDADKLDGGAGHDTISYERRSAAVSRLIRRFMRSPYDWRPVYVFNF